jgi:hypothetical protein
VYIPQEITENAGEYQMILVIAENEEEEIPGSTDSDTTGGTNGDDSGTNGETGESNNPGGTGDEGETGEPDATNGSADTGTPNQGQAIDKQEFFTSQVFGGSVVPSLFPIIQKFHEIHGEEDLLDAPKVK